jgi:hypothetical protein
MDTTSKLQVALSYDSDVEDPNARDGDWKLYSFCHRHTAYTSHAKLRLSLDRDLDGLPVRQPVELRKRLSVGLAFWLSYFEHGSCIWFIKGSQNMADMRWDGVKLAGLLVWEHGPQSLGAKEYADRENDAMRFLAEYTASANGEVYCWDILNADDEFVDCCGGYYSDEDACDALAVALAGREFKFYGEWAESQKEYLLEAIRGKGRQSSEVGCAAGL